MSAEKWRENCRPGDFWFYGEIAKVANMARDFCPWAEQEREVHQLEVQCHQNWMQHRPPCIAACVTSRCLMHNITIYTFRPRPLENKVQFLDLIHTEFTHSCYHFCSTGLIYFPTVLEKIFRVQFWFVFFCSFYLFCRHVSVWLISYGNREWVSIMSV